MSKESEDISPEDEKIINHIVDKLKREGLFDQFRKECLADVDTKPAYLNLRVRVEGFVNSFLSSQEWSPDNKIKNQLRDNLRKQLTLSRMLQNGVDLIVEQVVNPKINKVFKPQIDKVLCEYLGIDPDLREEKLRTRDEFERQKIIQEQKQRQKEEQKHNSLNNQGNNFGSPRRPGNPIFPQNGNMPRMPGYGMPCMPGMPNIMDVPYGREGMNPNMPPGMPNMNFPPPNFGGHMSFMPNYGSMPPNSTGPISGFNIPGMNTHSFPQGHFPMPGMGPMFPNHSMGMGMAGMSGVPGYSMNSMPDGMPPSVSMAVSGAQPVTPSKIEEEMKQKEKKEKEKPKEKKKEIQPLTVESLLNIPLPKQPPPPESKKVDIKKVEKLKENTPEETVKTDVMMKEIAKNVEDVGGSEDVEPVKKYHFAWDDMGKDDSHMSDISVSTIHTSDLSSFEDDLSNYFESSEDEAEEATEKSGEENMETEEVERDSLLEKKPDKKPVPEVPLSFKPRKLIALQYNYSDSEDEESRLERKSRIAKEKEDRYLRRQQRRAEIESKRKEYEEKRRSKLEEKRRAKYEEMKAKPQDPADEVKEDKAKKAPLPKRSLMRKRGAASRKGTPRKLPTKEELKEQLRAHKVMEKRMALRRRRTRNKKYLSDEYESIFSERKNMFSNEGYENVEVIENVEQSVEVETEISQEGTDYTHGISLDRGPPTPTQDERCEYSVPDNEVIVSQDGDPSCLESAASSCRVGSRGWGKRHSDDKSQPGSRPGTPHSDISDLSSMADSVDSRGRRSSLRRRYDDLPDRSLSPYSKSPEDRRLSQRYDASDLYKPRVSRRRLATSLVATPNDTDAHRTGSRQMDTPVKEVQKVVESERVKTQRYDNSDLYKPRISYSSRRRPPSPKDSRSPSPERRRGIQPREPSLSPSPERQPHRRILEKSVSPDRVSHRGRSKVSRSPSPDRRGRWGIAVREPSHSPQAERRYRRAPQGPSRSPSAERPARRIAPEPVLSDSGSSTPPYRRGRSPSPPLDKDMLYGRDRYERFQRDLTPQPPEPKDSPDASPSMTPDELQEAELKREKRSVARISFGEAEKKASSKKHVEYVDFGEAAKRAMSKDFTPVPPVAQGVTMARGTFRPRLPGPPGMRMPIPPVPHQPSVQGRSRPPMGTRGPRFPPPPPGAPPPLPLEEFDEDIRRPVRPVPDPEFGEAARRAALARRGLGPPIPFRRGSTRGGLSPRAGYEFRGGYRGGFQERGGFHETRQWNKPSGPPDEHWSKYGPGGIDTSDDDSGGHDSDDEETMRTRAAAKEYPRGGFTPARRKSSPRRPASPSDEGEVEEEDEDYEVEAKSRLPMARSSSPEEGEERSDGEATPSPPAKRLRAISPNETRDASPNSQRRYSSDMSSSSSPTRRRPVSPGKPGRSVPVGVLHSPDARRQPPPIITPRNIPMTRATRKRSEEDKLPPSKRLRNMNRV